MIRYDMDHTYLVIDCEQKRKIGEGKEYDNELARGMFEIRQGMSIFIGRSREFSNRNRLMKRLAMILQCCLTMI